MTHYFYRLGLRSFNFTLCTWIFITLVLMELQLKEVKGLLCYRCDSVNQGETCEGRPASRHIRNYGDQEPCLTFEEVNTQYLALQKELDMDWYYSVLNGDHGLPIQLLRNGIDNSTGNQGHGDGPFIHSDRDLACLFVRSTFSHDLDADEGQRSHPSFVLWFRKCVQIPALDMYPVCGDGNIYKGTIVICVCRDDKCNMDRARESGQTLIVGHHLNSAWTLSSTSYLLYFLLALIKLIISSFH